MADGADAISFGDTTGMATPRRVTRLVGEFRTMHPDVPLNLHFHNTRGTGLANVLAALELGADDFDASVGGLGGCPYAPGASGNIATEELVHMVEDMGVATGVDLEAMISAAAEAERIIGRQLPSQVLRQARVPVRSRCDLQHAPSLTVCPREYGQSKVAVDGAVTEPTKLRARQEDAVLAGWQQ